MNIVFHRMAIWIAIFVFFCYGCKSSEKPRTPELAVANLHQALLQDNAKAFANCFDATPKEKDLLLALFSLMQETRDLEQALIGAYGRESVDGKMGRQYPYAELRDENALKETEIDRIGLDNAIVILPGGKRKIRIYEKDDSWLFPMKHMVPPFVDRASDRIAAVYQMTGVIRDARDKVGKEGQDAKTIQQEMRIGLWQLVDEWKKQSRTSSAN